MNPLGLLILALGIVLVVVGVKGSQHNLVDALTKRAKTTGTTAKSSTTQGTQPI